MAVMATVFTEAQRSTLEALCDTFVPRIESDTGDPLERDFMARSASDMQIAAQIEAMLADALTPEEAAPATPEEAAKAPAGLGEIANAGPDATPPSEDSGASADAGNTDASTEEKA